MMKFYKIIFVNLLLMGTFMAISSFSWLSMWIGLEINLLAIIPLLKNTKNILPAEAAMKYFITQAMASTIIMFTTILMLNMSELLLQKSSILNLTLLSTAFLIKMGSAPFHFWLPEVLEGLSWNSVMIMLTWQKIAPLMLLSNSIILTTYLSIIIILSSLISGIMGINQVSMRKIMAYSSINHMSWMISAILTITEIWMYYFLIYCIITFSMIYIFKKENINYLIQLSLSMNNNKPMKITYMLNLFSLGGLPPLLGFLPKWLTINMMINKYMYFMSTILIIMTLITLYFYMRITFSSLSLNTEECLIMVTKNMSSLFYIFNMMNLTGLFICNVMYTLF